MRFSAGFPGKFARDRLDPLDRRGPPRTSTSTKNQPCRPILMQFRGERKNPARVPSGTQNEGSLTGYFRPGVPWIFGGIRPRGLT